MHAEYLSDLMVLLHSHICKVPWFLATHIYYTESELYTTFCPIRVSSTPKISVLRSARFFRLACTCRDTIICVAEEKERWGRETREVIGKERRERE